jgi:hypothetical protein
MYGVSLGLWKVSSDLLLRSRVSKNFGAYCIFDCWEWHAVFKIWHDKDNMMLHFLSYVISPTGTKTCTALVGDVLQIRPARVACSSLLRLNRAVGRSERLRRRCEFGWSSAQIFLSLKKKRITYVLAPFRVRKLRIQKSALWWTTATDLDKGWFANFGLAQDEMSHRSADLKQEEWWSCRMTNFIVIGVSLKKRFSNREILE